MSSADRRLSASSCALAAPDVVVVPIVSEAVLSASVAGVVAVAGGVAVEIVFAADVEWRCVRRRRWRRWRWRWRRCVAGAAVVVVVEVGVVVVVVGVVVVVVVVVGVVVGVVVVVVVVVVGGVVVGGVVVGGVVTEVVVSLVADAVVVVAVAGGPSPAARATAEAASHPPGTEIASAVARAGRRRARPAARGRPSGAVRRFWLLMPVECASGA